VESFKSTLDEVRECDILMHVVDISHPQFEEQIKTVNATLQELGCLDKPMLMIFNKMDLYEKKMFDELLPEEIKDDILTNLKKTWMAQTNNHAIFISAAERQNVDELRERMYSEIKKMYTKRYPYKAEFF